MQPQRARFAEYPRTDQAVMEPDCAATAVVALNQRDEPTTSLQSSPRSESQESQASNTKNLKSCLKPLETSLRMCGLIWKGRDNVKFDAHSVYAVAVSVAAWISALRLFAIYDHQDTYGANLIKKVATQGWHIQMAIIISSFIFKFYMLQPRLVRRWEYYKRKYVGVPLHHMMTFTYRATTIIDVAFGAILIIFIITFTARTPDILLFQLEPFSYGKVHAAGAFFYFLFDSFLVFIWLQPFLYLSVMAMLLRKEFLELTKNFRAAICATPDATKIGKGRRLDLEGYRLRHLALCKICEKLDDIMSPFILSTFMIDIPLICSLVYILASIDTSVVAMFPSVAAAALCFVIAMIHLVGVTVIGATLTAAAKSPKTTILDVDLRSCTSQEGVCLQVFLVKVTLDHIGLTVWKMLQIDRPLLIAVFSLVLTYVVLLFKFALALGKVEAGYNAILPNMTTPRLGL